MNNLQLTQFVVLTCDKYIFSRGASIKNTWGKSVNTVILSDTENLYDNNIGYNTPKTYEGIQDKYLSFFKNYNFSPYKYYFFVDDDTFILLANFNKLALPGFSTNTAVIRELQLNPDRTDKWGNDTGYPLHAITGHNTQLPLTHPSGGSGFILTQTTCLLIQNYLNTAKFTIPRTAHGDVTIGFWLRAVQTRLLFNNDLWWEIPEKLKANTQAGFTDKNETTAITFHYVNEKNMLLYNKKYNIQYETELTCMHTT